ncbi:MAG: hypothetical protein HY291_08925 [Planctomycetes bacterium]|nr:hypothetical protein [Planctomycetota bacterium]
MKNSYLVISGVIFGVVAVVQGLRAYNQWPVQIGTEFVPVWASWVAVVVAGILCIWGLIASRKAI